MRQFQYYKLKKHRWCAWDLNPGLQDCTCRQNHGAMAAAPFTALSPYHHQRKKPTKQGSKWICMSGNVGNRDVGERVQNDHPQPHQYYKFLLSPFSYLLELNFYAQRPILFRFQFRKLQRQNRNIGHFPVITHQRRNSRLPKSFKNGPFPVSLLFNVRLFQTNINTILQQINVEKYPSSVQC